jgi:serine/threonine protein kinase
MENNADLEPEGLLDEGEELLGHKTSEFDQLLDRHLEFLTRIEEEDSYIPDEVKLFLSSLSNSGKDILDRRQRSQLRGLIRFWSSYVYDNTGQFPDLQLAPAATELSSAKEPSSPDGDQDNNRAQASRKSSISYAEDRVGSFEIIDEIGSGGFSKVYKAFDVEKERVVALKVLQDEQFQRSHRFRVRLLEGDQVIVNLEHPHIIPVHCVAEHNGVPYIAMKLIESGSLADRLTGWYWRPTIRQILMITSQVASGLSYLHQNNIVHRDIKPANILLSYDDHVYLSDFGIAQVVESTFPDLIVGTPAYLSPEAILQPNNIDGRADVYSLGVVLYQLLNGDLPFVEDKVPDLLYAQVKAAIPPIEHLVKEIANVVERCLCKDRSKRFQSALDLQKELDDLLLSVADHILDSRPFGFTSNPEFRRSQSKTKRLSMDDLSAAGLSPQPTPDWWISSPALETLYAPSSRPLSQATFVSRNCPKCNSALRNTARYCQHCGFSLTSGASQEVSVAVDLSRPQTTLLKITENDTLILESSTSSHSPSNKTVLGILLVSPHTSVKGNDFYIIRHARTTIGRGEHSDITVPEDSLSLQHALLAFKNEKGQSQFELYDLASTNGTFVNGKVCLKCILKHNDLIRLGRVEMIFKRLDDGPGSEWWQNSEASGNNEA